MMTSFPLSRGMNGLRLSRVVLWHVALLLQSSLIVAYTASVRGRGMSSEPRGTVATDSQRELQGGVSLDIINTVTNTKHATLTNGQVIVVGSIPGMTTPKFNINAIFTSPPQSVVFGHNGNPKVQMENNALWAFCGNNGPAYLTCPLLGYGKHTVTATAYGGKNGSGQKGASINITFEIVASQPQVVVPPTKSPVQPTKSPVQPTNSPVQPTNSPVQPISSPVQPTNAPIQPTNAPVQPTSSPVTSSTGQPASSPVQQCRIPKLSGTSWQSGTPLPITVSEAVGGMIGKKLLVTSGFNGTWLRTTVNTYLLDTDNPNAKWETLDDQPLILALTHSGSVAIGDKFYMCGGYLGGGAYNSTGTCMILDISKPKGQQWSFFAPLPAKQSGGGMIFDKTLNALIFAGGQLRVRGSPTIDLDHTWMYSFNNTSAGWVARAPIPYLANHISTTTAKDGNGVERHFYSGGQEKEGEGWNNVVHHYEYMAVEDKWVKRRDVPFPRGHASESTRPIGCGYIVSGGTTNGWQRRSDVTYYDIPTDTWTKIGDLPAALNTPVCDINRDTNMLHCESGALDWTFSVKREILV